MHWNLLLYAGDLHLQTRWHGDFVFVWFVSGVICTKTMIQILSNARMSFPVRFVSSTRRIMQIFVVFGALTRWFIALNINRCAWFPGHRVRGRWPFQFLHRALIFNFNWRHKLNGSHFGGRLILVMMISQRIIWVVIYLFISIFSAVFPAVSQVGCPFLNHACWHPLHWHQNVADVLDQSITTYINIMIFACLLVFPQRGRIQFSLPRRNHTAFGNDRFQRHFFDAKTRVLNYIDIGHFDILATFDILQRNR